ncbi:MAG: MFS transporter [Hyphomicrobiaceae bacterium]
MTSRWSILVLLFLVRTGMGFQFQAVPAMSPLFLSGFGVSLADIGLLIGLYHAPGIVLAVPGGAIGQRFGDKRTVVVGLFLMVVGGLAMAFATTWPVCVAGRLVAGIGGILLNVLMSKMVTDWFAGRELATAMGIFVNSWPFGIALALVTLPAIAKGADLAAALCVVTGLLVVAFLAMLALYRSPGGQSTQSVKAGVQGLPTGHALWAVLSAGCVWGFYNASLAMIFGFGPLMLVERGWDIAAASSATSIVLWLVVLSVPLGGLLADRSGRPTTILFTGIVLFAALLLAAGRVDHVLFAFVALGLVSGLPAGPIMSLPARVLAADTRAVGMGLFFTVFYVVQLSAPWMAGVLAKTRGTTWAAFDFGAALLAICIMALIGFLRLASAWNRAQEVPTAR